MKLVNLFGSKRVANSDVIPMAINEQQTTPSEDAHEEACDYHLLGYRYAY